MDLMRILALCAAILMVPTARARAGTLDLHKAVEAACPQIVGVSRDGTVWFRDARTRAGKLDRARCRRAALAIMRDKAKYFAPPEGEAGSD